MLKKKNILIISPEPWEHIKVSKHHYATTLAQNSSTVYFLNPPSNQTQINSTEYKNIFSVNYTGHINGIRFLPRFLVIFFMKITISKLEKLCNTKFDIAWSFDNSVFFELKTFSKKTLKICHMVDLNQNFQLKKAAKSADICFGTSDLIISKLKKYNSNSYKVNHGYNPINQTKTLIPGNSTVKAIYAGNLNIPYIDWETLFTTLSSNPQVDFIFAGPGNESSSFSKKAKCIELKNAFFIGKIKTEELQYLYNHIDVHLLCYQEKHIEQCSNPHKMMEYLSSGNVIVSTKTIEYQSLKNDDLVIMSEQNKDYNTLFSKAINNLDILNTSSKKEKRKAFALSNTYSNQLERIESLIKKTTLNH